MDPDLFSIRIRWTKSAIFRLLIFVLKCARLELEKNSAVWLAVRLSGILPQGDNSKCIYIFVSYSRDFSWFRFRITKTLNKISVTHAAPSKPRRTAWTILWFSKIICWYMYFAKNMILFIFNTVWWNKLWLTKYALRFSFSIGNIRYTYILLWDFLWIFVFSVDCCCY